jgi:gamma-glutamylcyclotransferase (GGCT)/AIG2-like uncharacterized protein YtfP
VNFFVYGSLLFGEVMQAVTGTRYEGECASISGYARFLVSGATYPGLIPSEGDRVKGILYSGITEASMDWLDAFEGKYYHRQRVFASTRTVDSVAAETYVFRIAYRELLTDQPWDADRFRKEHLSAFLRSYQGFTRVEPDKETDA